MDDLYSLVFCGKIAQEHDPAVVRRKVQALLKADSSHIDRLFSGQKVYLKKELDRVTVERYKQYFESTGAICAVELDAQFKPVLLQTPPAKMINCPKCDMEQKDTSTCIGCGIIIAKYERMQEHQKYGIPKSGCDFSAAAPDRSMQTESVKNNVGGLSTLIRTVMIVALIVLGGYWGYQQFTAATDRNEVFTSNDCGDPCESAIGHLESAGVEFIEYNVDASEGNLKKFMKHRTNSLPLAVINNKTLNGYSHASYQAAIADLQGKYLEESANTVVMYSARGCGYCRQAQEFFAENEIEYIEHYISDSNSRWRYEELGGRGTPLILINGTRIDGFDREATTKELHEAGLM